MRYVAIAALGAAVLGLACGDALTAPKPSEVPIKWEFDFTFDTPKPIRLDVPGESQPVTFWYVVYTVTNQGGTEQYFLPNFVLYADTGQILRSGRGVPGMAFREIKKTLNLPLLIDQADIAGPLLRGKNNARQGVMIFTDIDPKAGAFDIFVAGLSGETVKVRPPNPVPTVVYDREGKKKVEMAEEIVLAKTLQLSFSLPGEAAARFQTPTTLVQKQWVMR